MKFFRKLLDVIKIKSFKCSSFESNIHNIYLGLPVHHPLNIDKSVAVLEFQKFIRTNVHYCKGTVTDEKHFRICHGMQL